MSHHKDLQRELDARIPRRRRGSLQNEFRFCWQFFRSQGNSFDVSRELALSIVRQKQSDFAPEILR